VGGLGGGVGVGEVGEGLVGWVKKVRV